MARVDHDYAAEIRRTLTDPRRLCEKLGLAEGAKRQAGDGLLVRCPAHDDRSASCSVTLGKDRTIRCKCFACDWSGDALTLIAEVHGLNVRTAFRDVLLEAAGIAGLHNIVAELTGGKKYEPRPIPPPAPPRPDPEYAPSAEVAALWAAAGPCDEDEDSRWHLEGRGIDAREASQRGLARALCLANGLWCPMPQWARYKGAWWPEHGYRIVIPTFDAAGAMRGVRAWRVTDGDGPKRLPPAGHRAAGLVLANGVAAQVLRGERTSPVRVIVCEGEPDAISWSLRDPNSAVLGVLSGSWTPEFAKRIPLGSEVIVRTHHDEAGERYASEVVKSVRERAVVKRSAA